MGGSLLSITYSIPVNVFPVHWTQEDGTPIRFRDVGEPVQGEPAFDPFALMDEQPRSEHYTVKLAPKEMGEDQRIIWEFDDEEELIELHRQGEQEIGCCGFPSHEIAPDKKRNLCGGAELSSSESSAEELNPRKIG